MKHLSLLPLLLALQLPAFGQSTSEPAPSKEVRPHLGLVITKVPKVLSAQLKLQPGMGLVVESVEPGSPAASANIRQYDILLKFDDQLLADFNQLAALVLNHDVQKPVKLTLIREGSQTELSVKLENREVRPPLKRVMGFFDGHPAPAPGMQHPGVPFNVPLPEGKTKIFRSRDEKGTFVLSDREGKKEVHFAGPGGEVIFEGEVSGGGQEMPEVVRQKLEELENQERPLGDVLHFMEAPDAAGGGI